MHCRRTFLKASALGAAALTGSAFGATNQRQQRFVFLRKSSGLYPESLAPKSFTDAQMQSELEFAELDVALRNHELPRFLKPLEDYREHVGILQGLSGKMMRSNSHGPGPAAMGLVASNGGLSGLERASIDFELARLFPSVFTHIGFAASEHDKRATSPGFSIKEAGVPNFVYRTPAAAYQAVFGAAASDQDTKQKFALEDDLFRFVSSRQTAKARKGLNEAELRKVTTYADTANEIVERNAKLVKAAPSLSKYAPEMAAAWLADDPRLTERQAGHFEIATAALIAGLTNVATINLDSNMSYYTVGPLEDANVHKVGHNPNTYGKLENGDARDVIKEHHFSLIARMIKQLKAAPEGDGCVFDNTTIIYFPDNGEKHHAWRGEYPFVVISGKNSKLNLGGRYLRVPPYGEREHKTLGNWYTTLLNAYGNPMEHYGPLDPLMAMKKFDQVGAIKEIMA